MTQLDIYQQFVHLSRYSRWREDLKRRENWKSTVDRYISFFSEKFPDKYPKELIRDAILNLEVMPSMRALMTAGPALERDAISGFNCLSGDTLVTTLEYGIVPIETLKGKEVHIVDGNGKWVRSTCKSYGKQHLYKITFNTSGSGRFSIKATKDHRWILKDGSEKITQDLNKNDRLASVSAPENTTIDINSNDINKNPGFGMIDGVSYYGYEEVFCFDVPTTHSFLLSKNLLTGNCTFVAIDHPRALDEILYALMCGSGVRILC